jgi:hypothetical protein
MQAIPSIPVRFCFSRRREAFGNSSSRSGASAPTARSGRGFPAEDWKWSPRARYPARRPGGSAALVFDEIRLLLKMHENDSIHSVTDRQAPENHSSRATGLSADSSRAHALASPCFVTIRLPITLIVHRLPVHVLHFLQDFILFLS